MKNKFLVSLIFTLSLVCFVSGCSKDETTDKVKKINTTIAVSRDNAWGGKFLDYDVYVDGKRIGSVENGENQVFNLSLTKGTHEIYMKKFVKSEKLEFDVSKKHAEFVFTCKTKNGLGIDMWEGYAE